MYQLSLSMYQLSLSMYQLSLSTCWSVLCKFKPWENHLINHDNIIFSSSNFHHHFHLHPHHFHPLHPHHLPSQGSQTSGVPLPLWVSCLLIPFERHLEMKQTTIPSSPLLMPHPIIQLFLQRRNNHLIHNRYRIFSDPFLIGGMVGWTNGQTGDEFSFSLEFVLPFSAILNLYNI